MGSGDLFHKQRGLTGISLALLLIFLLHGSGRVLAHAELLNAYPTAGQTFQWDRPDRVQLEFSQPLQADGTEIALTNRQFDLIETGPTTIDPEDSHVVSISLPGLPPGTYTVTWRTFSVDGHPLEGSYSFTILPRERYITMGVAAVVLSAMGLLVFARRARPGDLDD